MAEGRRKRVIGILAAAAVVSAGAFLLIRSRSYKWEITDEYNLDKSRFLYVNWHASPEIIKAKVGEILDYKTFRTGAGSIVMLCAVTDSDDRKASVEFMKKNILGREAVIAIYGKSADYAGVLYGVVFYDNVNKCLNRELYKKGLVNVNIRNRYFLADKWFNAEAD